MIHDENSMMNSLKLGHLGIEAVYPLAPMQRDLYLTSVLHPDTRDVCVGLAISMNEPFDIAAWKSVLLEFHQEQPILRTRIYQGAEQPDGDSETVACQCVLRQASLNFDVQDLRAIELSEDKIESLVRDFIYAPYDIHSNELVRYRVWRLSNNRTICSLACHHIVMDGISGVLHLNQSVARYNEYVENGINVVTIGSTKITKVKASYLELAEKHCQDFDSDVIRDFWSPRLRDIEPLSMGGRPVIADDDNHIVREFLTFDTDQFNEIKSYCRKNVITPAIFLRCVYAVMLNQYAHPVKPFMVHSAQSARPKGHELSMGLYVNQISFVFNPSDMNDVVKHLFAEARQFQKSVRGHEQLSIGMRKQLSSSEELEFVYNFIDFIPSIKVSGVEAEVSRFTNYPQHQVQLVVQLEGSGFTLNLNYYPADFDSYRFLDRMGAVIRQLLAGETDLKALQYVLPDERGHLTKWNETATEYPKHRAVHTLFEEQVAQAPNNDAVVCGDKSVSYQELNQQANRLAHFLLAQGVQPGTFVGLCLERSFDLVVGALAVLKVNAAYVPLDPGYPAERLAYMLEDCEISIVLTQLGLEENLHFTEQQTVCCLDDETFLSELNGFSSSNVIDNGSRENEGATNTSSGEQLAYVIYTSGSTGRPKGVCVSHKGISRLVRNTNYIEITPNDNMAHISNVSFDAATFELWGALLNGATIVVVEREVLLSDDDLVRYFTEKKVSVMFITTALFNYYANNRIEIFKPFRVIMFGGDACDPKLVMKVYDSVGPEYMINGYGPTENTVFSCCYEVQGLEKERHTIPIGSPISNTTAYVLDKHRNPLPMGISGELYLGGDGVAQGYLNRPDLTEKVFIEDPGLGLLYRTGDWVRMNREGQVEYLGRIDDQVKIRGFRIETGEIEKNLLDHDQVSEAVVIAREDHPGHKVLVAYYVPVEQSVGERTELEEGLFLESGGIETSDLRKFMKSRLPDYMVPSAFVILDELPLTPNGKVNKKVLPRPENAGGDTEYLEPTTFQEKILAQIWSEVLGGKRIGVNDNFFELGGDSIITIQIISRAKRAGLHLQPQQMFEHQTIAELASIASSQTIEIIAEQGFVEGDVALLPIQQWFFNEHKEDREHFNHGVMLEVNEAFSESDLKQSLIAIVEKHDGLRLQFYQPQKEWTQRFRSFEQIQIKLHRLELERSDWEDKDRLIHAFANTLQTSFKFEEGELFAFGFIKTPSGEKNRLLLVVHHLIIDVVSWRIVLDDINLGLDQVANGQEINLGSKTTSVQQWVKALIEYANTDVVRDKVKHWSTFSTVDATPLPVDSVNDLDIENTYGQMEEHIATLDNKTTQQLLSLANNAYRTEIEDLLLSALAKTISEWSQRECDADTAGGTRTDKIYLQLESHGRENISPVVDVTSTLGWYTSVYPVLLDLDGINVSSPDALGQLIQSIKEQLRHVDGSRRASSSSGVGNSGLSFGLLRYLSDNSKIRQLLEDIPTPEIVFNYLGQLDNLFVQEQNVLPATESVGDMCGEHLKRQHLLDINCRIQDGQFSAHWSYNPNIHDAATIKRVADEYNRCLSQLIAFCLVESNRGLTPSDVPLLEVDQPTLDKEVKSILAQSDGYTVNNIQSIYPLSPMQEGMLFHSVFQPESAFYMDQMELRVEGGVDLSLLAKAWQRVVDRHDILRTAFIYNGVRKPIQVVYDKVEMAIDILDWSTQEPEYAQREFDQWLIEDKMRGFEFFKPGLLRFAWVMLPGDEQRLVWTFQHILLDGWSLPLVLGEMMQTYSDLLNGTPLPSGVVPQYQQFIRWLSHQPKDVAETFWSDYLKGFGAPNVFPQMKTVPLDISTRGKWKEEVIEWDGDKLGRLNAIAHEHHLTLNTIVQGVWAILLSRYSRESDVVFGTTVSGRPTELPGVEHTVGIFINTLPLRTSVSGDAPLIDWLQQLQQRQVDMRRYEHVPLVDVQSVSEVPSKQSLFESIVVFENYPIDEGFFDYLPIKLTEVRLFEHANYPLTLIVAPGETLTFKMSYNDTLFEKSDVDRMLGHLNVMLDGLVNMANDPKTSIGDLPWLTSAEIKQVTQQWNQTYTPYPADRSLMDLFEEKVAQFPNHTAVTFGSEQLSYSSLNEISNQMARCLVGAGVKPHDTVAIAMDRSVAMIVGTLAVLKVGGNYVPVDTSYPDDRIAYMLVDTAAPVLITGEANRPMKQKVLAYMTAMDAEIKLPSFIVWEAFQKERSNYESSNLDITVESSALAYVMYTSGSTGKPKGVRVPQKAVSRLVVNTNFLEVLPGDTLAHISNVSFDAATLEIWGALLNGGEIVGFEKEILFDAERFSAALTAKKIKAMFVTVALFNLLTKQKIDTFAGVHTVLFGGEAGDPNQVRNVLKGLGGKAAPKRLMNGYGPTENTTFSTYYHVTSLDESATNVPIGAPVANSTVYILDEDRRPVPLGVPGELYVGGQGVACGYLNQDDLTKDRFIPDIYCDRDVDDAMLYRTGDICRFREDGNIELLGRVDDQVKIRGFRIELGEVESNIKMISGVGDACVLVKEDKKGEKQMIAYILLDALSDTEEDKPGVEHTVGSLKSAMKQRVPNYLVPSAFMFIDHIPMTANGKVDKRALPEPDDSCYETKQYVMPKNEIERQLAVIWQEVLELKRVSVNDDFFDLGGHSLLVTQVVSRVREEIGVELRIRSLFEATTIASIAEIISVTTSAVGGDDDEEGEFEEVTL